MRFNELISGVRADVALKVYGDDLAVLDGVAAQIEQLMGAVPGAADAQTEQTTGLPILTVTPRREVLPRYGLNVADVQALVAAAYGGQTAGVVYEGDRRSDIVLRLPEALRNDSGAMARLPVPLPDGDAGPGGYVPLGEVATVALEPGPNAINREQGKRRVVVTANVRGRDLGAFIAELQRRVDAEIAMPPGYWLDYGGSFEQLESAARRCQCALPLVLPITRSVQAMPSADTMNAP